MAQRLLELEYSIISDLVGSNQFMSYPQRLCHSFRGCVLPLPSCFRSRPGSTFAHDFEELPRICQEGTLHLSSPDSHPWQSWENHCPVVSAGRCGTHSCPRSAHPRVTSLHKFALNGFDRHSSVLTPSTKHWCHQAPALSQGPCDKPHPKNKALVTTGRFWGTLLKSLRNTF